MCSFIVLMPSVRIYNVNSHENKENALNEKVCPNFWPVLYMCIYVALLSKELYKYVKEHTDRRSW